MNFLAVSAQLEFLAWRDAQFAAISQQLEEAFPDLLDGLSKHVGSASIVNLVRSSVALRSSTEAILQRWGADQLATSLSRAEAEMDQSILRLPGRINLDRNVWEQVTQALPAMAGVGLIGASLAAIPTVISFATVSTSIFAFWGMSAISWPLFALGAAGIGVATLTGSHSLKLAEEKAREKLCRRLHSEAGRQVFGIGDKPGARCILSDIQAAIVKAGQSRFQGALS